MSGGIERPTIADWRRTKCWIARGFQSRNREDRCLAFLSVDSLYLRRFKEEVEARNLSSRNREIWVAAPNRVYIPCANLPVCRLTAASPSSSPHPAITR